MRNDVLSVIGWYGRGNVGDEGFKIAINNLIGINYSLQFGLEPLDDSLVILGGGDVVHPFYLDKIKNDAPIIGLGLGLIRPEDIDFLRGKNIKKLFFRSQEDCMVALRSGFDAEYLPDLMFSLERQDVFSAKFDDSPGKKRLGIILNSSSEVSLWNNNPKEIAYFDYLKWELARCLDYLYEFYHIYWIPFSCDMDADDLSLNLDVRRRMKNRADHNFIKTPSSPEEALSIISSMDMVFTMRFHGMLYSIASRKPFLNFGIGRKNELFCQENDISDVYIPKYSFELNRFLKVLKIAESESNFPRINRCLEKNLNFWILNKERVKNLIVAEVLKNV